MRGKDAEGHNDPSACHNDGRRAARISRKCRGCGGHRGRGGNGGAALLCGSYQFAADIGDDARRAFVFNKLIGGAGGNGGSGGAGYAAGKTGNAGSGGSYGSRIAYH